MISIVICHRDELLLEELKQNIASSIGVVHELIIVDNTRNEYNICAAYNEGVKRSSYPIVCFAHEDILFHTENWGQKVVAHFDNEVVGMIGVLGGMAQSAIPAAWWYNTYYAYSATNLLMRKVYNDINSPLLLNYNNIYSEDKTEVVVIDGLWFCIRKCLFDNISFDKESFNGFHLYDADISMQVRQLKRNFVIYDILIEHKWDSSISKNYYSFLEVFNEKWKNALPASAERVPLNYLTRLSWHSLRMLLYEMKRSGFSRRETALIKNKYYSRLQKKYPSFWFGLYFLCRAVLAERLCFAIFYRVEMLLGINKDPGMEIREFN